MIKGKVIGIYRYGPTGFSDDPRMLPDWPNIGRVCLVNPNSFEGVCDKVYRGDDGFLHRDRCEFYSTRDRITRACARGTSHGGNATYYENHKAFRKTDQHCPILASIPQEVEWNTNPLTQADYYRMIGLDIIYNATILGSL